MTDEQPWWRSMVDRVARTDPERARQLERRHRARDRELARIDGQAEVAEADRRAMDACPMRAPNVRFLSTSECHRKWCYLCGRSIRPLDPSKAGRRSTWCSDACAQTWWENHSWQTASVAVLRRDGYRCQMCGRMRGDAIDPGHCREDKQPWPCAYIRRRPDDAPIWPHVRTGEMLVRLEVNHKVPRNGQGYHHGCHHHQADLETLCHGCHVEVTTAQGRARREAGRERERKDAGQLALSLG